MQSGIDTDRINGLVNRLIELTEQGVEFSVDQLPEIASEIVLWGAVAGLVAFSFVAVWLVATTVCVAWTFRALDDSNGEPTHKTLPGVIASLVLVFAGVPVVTVGTATALAGLKAFIAPRLYIIEYLQGML